MNEQIFLRCPHCGNMVSLIHKGGASMICCGTPMQELVPNTMDGAKEKHIPVVGCKERLVHAKVGDVAHPMTEEHHIEFIYLQTNAGGQIRRLEATEEASVMFAVLNDKPIAVYAYCNLHGLWKAEASEECSHTAEEDCTEDETICSAEFSEGCKCVNEASE